MEMFGLKQPLPAIRNSSAGKNRLWIAMRKWPIAMRIAPTTTALRWPSTLSASSPPKNGVKYTSPV